ncbi:PH domain-containing protein [Flavitalea sp.]|nr:PH domain-containing protein [Flavitalea sp.]
MIYKASLDIASKVITFLCFIVFIYVGYKTFTSASTSSTGINIYLVRIGVIMLLVTFILICYLLSTKSYKLTADQITITRPLRSFSIKLADIIKVELLSPEQLSGLIRTFGVGGMFGYYGKYYSSKLGPINLYTTQRRNRIMIVTKANVAIVISPDDPSLYQKLITSINELR